MFATERPEAPDVAQELFLPEDSLGILGEGDEELVLLLWALPSYLSAGTPTSDVTEALSAATEI
jgi:hypothetical protein